MNRNKIFYIAGGMFLLILVGGFLYNPIRNSIPEPLKTPFEVEDKIEQIGSSGADFTPPPQEKLEVSGVTINNVYKNEINRSGGNVKFLERDTYRATYVYDINLFTITILDANFEQTRQRAEQEFISMLGISKEDACKLNVIVQTPEFVNFELSQQNFSLSFCE